MAMTYEEYKAAVIAEFPPDLLYGNFLREMQVRDWLLLVAEGPLEERLEIARRTLTLMRSGVNHQINIMSRAIRTPAEIEEDKKLEEAFAGFKKRIDAAAGESKKEAPADIGRG